MGGIQYIIALVVIFYFFSIFFTVLLLLRLLRIRVRAMGIVGLVVLSAALVYLFFATGWVYSIDFRTLVVYSLIIFAAYLLSRAFIKIDAL